MVSFPKQPVYRNESLRRAVADLHCVCCGVWGFTQAAHIGGVAEGKGRGLKVSDARIAALCGDRPNKVGCHTQFDQRIIDNTRGPEFIAATYVALVEGGRLAITK